MVVSHDSHVSYDHVRVAGSDAGGISAEARSLSSSAMPDSYAAPFAAFSGAVPTLPLTGRLSTIICQQCPEFRVWSIPAGGVKGFRHPLRESSPPLRGQYIIGKDDDDCISHRARKACLLRSSHRYCRLSRRCASPSYSMMTRCLGYAISTVAS